MGTTSLFGHFRTRLILLGFLLVIPAFGLVLYGNLEQRRLEKARVREGVVATAQLAAANQENFIKNTRQLLGTLAQVPYLVLSTNRPLIELHFSNLRKLAPDYLNFGLIEADGTLFCSAAATNQSLKLGDRPYFQRAMKTKEFSIGDFQIGRLTDQQVLNFGYPVLDERGELKRVLFAALKLSLLSEAAKSLQLPSGGIVVVSDRNGNLLARHPEAEKWVGKSVSDSSLVQKILAQKEGVFEMADADGIARLHAVTTIKDGQAPGLFVSVGVPLDVSFAHANQALVRNFLVLGLVALVVLVGAQLYARRFFLRPVNALASSARRLAEGDLSARTGAIGGATELVQLGRAFDEMGERLQKRQEEIKLAQQEIVRLNEDLERRVVTRTSQLETANKELEAFSYSVSHDLRAPLRHIDGFATMLQQRAGGKLDDKEIKFLDIICEAAKQMGRLIDDLLVFSRMNHQQMDTTLVDLEQLVQETLLSLEHDSKGRNVVWKNSPLPKVEGDPAMLRQVFANLLSNALKYTGPRDPALIEIGCFLELSGELIVFVRDNGVGFDMQYAHKLFGVFQRLHHQDDFKGTGIGLANVRRIVSRHGGRTWAESKPDQGATFYFSLPHTLKK
jgi:signal transduction histidine kinase